MSEWLNNLKVGDLVIVIGGGMSGDRISKVGRMTKTQIILDDSDSKYRRNDGSGFGGGAYSRGLLTEPTQEKIDQVRQERFARYLSRYEWSGLPLDTLAAVYKLLPPPKKN